MYAYLKRNPSVVPQHRYFFRIKVQYEDSPRYPNLEPPIHFKMHFAAWRRFIPYTSIVILLGNETTINGGAADRQFWIIKKVCHGN